MSLFYRTARRGAKGKTPRRTLLPFAGHVPQGLLDDLGLPESTVLPVRRYIY